MQDALKAQQQGERRSGAESVPHFERAVQLYQQSFQTELPDDLRQDMRVLVADTLYKWAQAVLDAEAALPDEQQSAAVEAQAQGTAAQLLLRAVQVRDRRQREWRRRCHSCDSACTTHIVADFSK